jgi:hypothetical protein
MCASTSVVDTGRYGTSFTALYVPAAASVGDTSAVGASLVRVGVMVKSSVHAIVACVYL